MIWLRGRIVVSFRCFLSAIPETAGKAKRGLYIRRDLCYLPFFLASNYVPDMEPAKRKRFLIIEWVLVALLLVILIPLGVI